jgi:hypothetical protein
MNIDYEQTDSICLTALYKPDEIDYIYFLSYKGLVYIFNSVSEASLTGMNLGTREIRRSLSFNSLIIV